MPRNAVVSRRYVRALGYLADESDPSQTQKILGELRGFSSTIDSSKLLRSFFLSPVIPKSDKREALTDLKDKVPLTYRFLIALVDGNRLTNLGEIVAEYEAHLESRTGELSVEVITARKLSDATMAEIKQSIEDIWKRKIKVKHQIDAEILGGFMARAPGKILDASARHQFEALRQSLS